MGGDSLQGFEFSRLNFVLSWALSQQDQTIKINGNINESVIFK